MKKLSSNLIYIGFLLFAATVSWTMSGQAAGIVIALLGWIIGIFAYRRFTLEKEKTSWFKIILAGFIIIFILSSIFSVNVYKSFTRTFYLLGEIGVFFAVLSYDWKKRNISVLFKILTVFAVVESLYGIIQYLTGTTILNYGDTTKHILGMFSNHDVIRRAFGTWDHPNSLGGILAMLIPITFFIGIISKGKKEKLFYLVSTSVMALGLMFTQTRGGWIGLIVSLLVLIIYKRKNLIFIPLAAVIIILVVPSTRSRIMNTFNFGLETERISMWRVAVDEIRQNPVLGTGPETFSDVFYNELLQKKMDTGLFQKRMHFHYHNTYLGLSAESGIFSIIIFLIFVGSILVFGFKGLHSVENKFMQSVLLGCIGTVIDFMVHGFVDYNLRGNTVYFFWFACGMIVFIASKRLVND
ncbi:MAG: O-antigen ligase family protein [Elusimicrobia bacterium]|nr:O-antigen ligase family protein [Elusimicrobiota bacterium]